MTANELEKKILKITFRVPLGQPTLSQKINEIELVKPTKREARKASFLWDLGLLFVHPINRTDISVAKFLW